MNVLDDILEARKTGETRLAQLIDPDHIKDFDHLADLAKRAEESGVNHLFFGGSLVTQKMEFDIIQALKKITSLPVTLFPSSPSQIDESADAILFLSLLSGRNPEYLIGHHVTAAPLLKNSSLEVIPTGYILVGCGEPTTAEYVSHSFPIPYKKDEIAASTALAGQLLGMKMIYLDGGSGAEKPISKSMISKVRSWIDTPIVVGGGIRTPKDARRASDAGADLIVVGNQAEKYPNFLAELKEQMR